VIAGDVYANDHHRASHLVLGLTVRDGLVADGAQLISAGTPDDVVIDQWPQRAVKKSFSNEGEKIHVHCLAPWRESDMTPPRKPFCISSEGADREYRWARREAQAPARRTREAVLPRLTQQWHERHPPIREWHGG
jgi:hypothetical protein